MSIMCLYEVPFLSKPPLTEVLHGSFRRLHRYSYKYTVVYVGVTEDDIS